jgi:hypothetical protein
MALIVCPTENMILIPFAGFTRTAWLFRLTAIYTKRQFSDIPRPPRAYVTFKIRITVKP